MTSKASRIHRRRRLASRPAGQLLHAAPAPPTAVVEVTASAQPPRPAGEPPVG